MSGTMGSGPEVVMLVMVAVLSEVYRLVLRALEFAVPDPREVDHLVEMLNGARLTPRNGACTIVRPSHIWGQVR